MDDDLTKRELRAWIKRGTGSKAQALHELSKSLDTIDALRDRVKVLEEARNVAYGLLWSITFDTREPKGRAWSKARNVLLATMSLDDQREGIEAARAALKDADT